MKRIGTLLLAAAAIVMAAPNLQAPALADDFIQVDVSGMPMQFRGLFRRAGRFWNSRITGYSAALPRAFRNSLNRNIRIQATMTANDGPGGVLGSAAPTETATWLGGGGGPFDTNGARDWVVSQAGQMNFDTADFTSGDFTRQDLEDIVIHEMAHALGFGSLWAANNLIGDTGQYDFDGFALETYRRESGDLFATFVPVEQDGGGGTAGAHWDDGIADTDGDGELDDFSGNLFNQTFTDAFQADYMLGFISQITPDGEIVTPRKFLTDTTLASMEDVGLGTVLGDDVALGGGIIKWEGEIPPPIFFRPENSVPEPGSMVLLIGLGVASMARRRR